MAVPRRRGALRLRHDAKAEALDSMVAFVICGYDESFEEG